MPLTQTVTQMRIGAESTGQFLPGAFRVYVSFLSDFCLRGHESVNFLFWEPLAALSECDIVKCSFHDYG